MADENLKPNLSMNEPRTAPARAEYVSFDRSGSQPFAGNRGDKRPIKRRRERLAGFTRRLRERSRNRHLQNLPSFYNRSAARLKWQGRRHKTAFALSAAAISLGSGGIATSTIAAMGPLEVQASAPAEMPDPQAMRVPADQLAASTQMMEALAQEEGVRLTVYRDLAGNPTVGVGHRVTAADGLNVGDVITYDHAIDLLEADLAASQTIVNGLVGDLPLFQHEFDALVDLAYNVGEGTVSASSSPALHRAIADADYERIADELMYRNAGGSFAEGLAYRSQRRKAIFLQGLYDDPRPHDAALPTSDDLLADIA